jgi:hypothetical protein
MDYVPLRKFWAVYDGGGTGEKPDKRFPSAGGKSVHARFSGYRYANSRDGREGKIL